MSRSKGQAGRRDGAEDEGESTFVHSEPGLLFVLPPGHSCHCSLKRSLGSSSPSLQQQPLHQTLTSRTAATASSACKIINWAISPTLIILGCCLLRLVLKPIQDIIYAVSCKALHAYFFYHLCQRCTNKSSIGKGITAFIANCDHASKTSHSIELIISHILTCGNGC